MTVERSPLAPTPLIPESFAAKYREAGYWIDQTIPEFLPVSYTHLAIGNLPRGRAQR